MKGFDPSHIWHICVLRDLALDLGIVLECLHRWWEAPGFGFLWPQAKSNKYNKYNEWNVFQICKTKLGMAIKFSVSPCLTMNSIGVMDILWTFYGYFMSFPGNHLRSTDLLDL